MRFVQFHVPDQGKRLGLIDGPTVTDITCGQCATVLDVVRLAAEGDCEMDEVVGECSRGAEFNYEELDIAPTGDKPHLLLPIGAPEVWGCGVTYQRSSDMRDGDSQSDIYSRVYQGDRPEIFFKATAARCAAQDEEQDRQEERGPGGAGPRSAAPAGQGGKQNLPAEQV